MGRYGWTALLACVLAALCACDGMQQDPRERFPVELKTTMLLVQGDLDTKGEVRDEYIERLTTIYNKYKGEFGTTKTYEMFDFVLRGLEIWRGTGWNEEYRGPYTSNKLMMMQHLEAEFGSPGG